MSVTTPIYLDNHSTTRCDPEVVDTMLPYFTEMYGNAASRTHRFGFEAKSIVEWSRTQISALIGCSPKEVIWTSGATEANNIAVLGAATGMASKGKHIVISQIEHKAVLEAAEELERRGWSITRVPPQSNGIVSIARVCEAIGTETSLVSLMYANNEIGTIQPITEIGRFCRNAGIVFHVDAVQAAGRLPIDVTESNIDLLTLSAHKMYGPKGVGCLFLRRGKPRVHISPLFWGGGHERGVRPGTLPVPLIAGMGKAAQLAKNALTNGEIERITSLRDILWQRLSQEIEGIQLNGDPTQRLCSTLNLSIERVEAQALMMSLRDIALSSGSACSSASLEPSYVLRAMGCSDQRAHASIRIGVGRFTTEDEIHYAADRIRASVDHLRGMSPIYGDV